MNKSKLVGVTKKKQCDCYLCKLNKLPDFDIEKYFAENPPDLEEFIPAPKPKQPQEELNDGDQTDR